MGPDGTAVPLPRGGPRDAGSADPSSVMPRNRDEARSIRWVAHLNELVPGLNADVEAKYMTLGAPQDLNAQFVISSGTIGTAFLMHDAPPPTSSVESSPHRTGFQRIRYADALSRPFPPNAEPSLGAAAEEVVWEVDSSDALKGKPKGLVINAESFTSDPDEQSPIFPKGSPPVVVRPPDGAEQIQVVITNLPFPPLSARRGGPRRPGTHFVHLYDLLTSRPADAPLPWAVFHHDHTPVIEDLDDVGGEFPVARPSVMFPDNPPLCPLGRI